jgi:hypothetical protein
VEKLEAVEIAILELGQGIEEDDAARVAIAVKRLCGSTASAVRARLMIGVIPDPPAKAT